MTQARPLAHFFRRLDEFSTFRWMGRVTKVTDYLVESEGPFCSIGEGCAILTSDGRTLAGEIVGFRDRLVLSMPLERPIGIRYGDRIVTRGTQPCLRVGPGLLGRVIDGTGKALDSKGSYAAREYWTLRGDTPLPLDRALIRDALGCGIRAIDGMLTCGRGQRMGIFGGSGVGKSTLVGMMTRGTSADMTVLALVGERGREVREFLEESLGEEGLARSVVVISTSDQPPLMRIRAALAATTVAEYFAAQGKHVLLVVDSLTRFSMAQREIGLAAGEPPTAKGYTPSVFTLLAQLLERAGHFGSGSITGFYTVLMEGDDQQDPLVDAVRAILDGHIILDRRLSSKGHYPPISILDSLSRLMPAVCTPEHLAKARLVRSLIASYAASEDLIRVGAYQKGGDPVLDRAVAALPDINTFLQQDKEDKTAIEQAIKSLLAIPD
ncbi:MAG TPA: FliI/YscN family ATPase [Candidatus Acidoferrum sp.]|nr:FliI/YscN family ATPase [Candidatus Acidoferrum sp.]